MRCRVRRERGISVTQYDENPRPSVRVSGRLSANVRFRTDASRMTEVTDTHRRAALRGREAVARGRIKSGVRAGRVLSLVLGVLSIVPLGLGGKAGWSAAGTLAAFAAGIFLATERMRHGSRVAACVLLAPTGMMALASWNVFLGGQPSPSRGWTALELRALWTVLTVLFANGVRGTFALASVQRDTAQVPPAPARPTGERRPI